MSVSMHLVFCLNFLMIVHFQFFSTVAAGPQGPPVSKFLFSFESVFKCLLHITLSMQLTLLETPKHRWSIQQKLTTPILQYAPLHVRCKIQISARYRSMALMHSMQDTDSFFVKWRRGKKRGWLGMGQRAQFSKINENRDRGFSIDLLVRLLTGNYTDWHLFTLTCIAASPGRDTNLSKGN